MNNAGQNLGAKKYSYDHYGLGYKRINDFFVK